MRALPSLNGVEPTCLLELLWSRLRFPGTTGERLSPINSGPSSVFDSTEEAELMLAQLPAAVWRGQVPNAFCQRAVFEPFVGS